MKLIIRLNESVEDIKSHLRDRGVDPLKTGVIVDEESNTATFLIYNLSGQLIGYQYYNPNGEKNTAIARQHIKTLKTDSDLASLKKYIKYYTRIVDSQKGISVYGLETYERDSEFLFVTEGVFDCAKIHNAGFPAVATLTNAGSPELKTWFKILPQKIVAIYDNDDSGEVLKKLSDYSFPSPEGYKDLGDTPQEIATEYIQKLAESLSGKKKTKKLKQ